MTVLVCRKGKEKRDARCIVFLLAAGYLDIAFAGLMQILNPQYSTLNAQVACVANLSIEYGELIVEHL